MVGSRYSEHQVKLFACGVLRDKKVHKTKLKTKKT